MRQRQRSNPGPLVQKASLRHDRCTLKVHSDADADINDNVFPILFNFYFDVLMSFEAFDSFVQPSMIQSQLSRFRNFCKIRR